MNQFDPGRNLRRAQRRGDSYFDGLETPLAPGARGARLGLAVAIVAGTGLLAALVLVSGVNAPPIHVDDRDAMRLP